MCDQNFLPACGPCHARPTTRMDIPKPIDSTYQPRFLVLGETQVEGHREAKTSLDLHTWICCTFLFVYARTALHFGCSPLPHLSACAHSLLGFANRSINYILFPDRARVRQLQEHICCTICRARAYGRGTVVIVLFHFFVVCCFAIANHRLDFSLCSAMHV